MTTRHEEITLTIQQLLTTVQIVRQRHQENQTPTSLVRQIHLDQPTPRDRLMFQDRRATTDLQILRQGQQIQHVRLQTASATPLPTRTVRPVRARNTSVQTATIVLTITPHVLAATL